MLHEIAVVPNVFDKTSPDVGTMSMFFRTLSETVMVADLHKEGWSKLLLDPTRSPLLALDQPVRKSIMEVLGLMKTRNRLVRHPKREGGPPTSDQDWFDLGVEAHNRHPLTCLLHQGQVNLPSPAPSTYVGTPVGFMNGASWMDCLRRNDQVEKTPAAVRPILAPFLRHARDLKLVDPYMKADQRFLELIDLVATLTGVGGSGAQGKTIELQLHTSVKPLLDEVKRRRDSLISQSNFTSEETVLKTVVAEELKLWETTLHGRLPSVPKFQVDVFIWGRNASDKLIHNRGIFTDQAAVSFESGLDLYPPGKADSDTCNLLDYDVRVQRLIEVTENSSPFRLEGKKRLATS